MKKIITILIIILSFSFLLSSEKTETSKAQDFELENMKGKKVKLSEVYKDKIVILDFWANWCTPCKKEMIQLDKLQKKYKDKIQIIAVSIDKARHVSKAKAFIKSKRYSFEVLFDTDNRVLKMYNVVNPPNTSIITKDGNIVWSHLGYKRGDEIELEKQIIKWIAAQATEGK